VRSRIRGHGVRKTEEQVLGVELREFEWHCN
jgi:hypothetical protein